MQFGYFKRIFLANYFTFINNMYFKISHWFITKLNNKCIKNF